MNLSCDCSNDYGGDMWYHIPPAGYSVLATSRRKRCASCRELIDVGAVVASFERFRIAEGADVYLADKYHCERCADLYFSLAELGFCINLGDSMLELVREYADVYGPPIA